MAQPQFDPWLAALFFALATASIATWIGLIHIWRKQPFPQYEFRRPVPWNWAAAMLAVLFVVGAVLSVVLSPASQPEQPVADWEMVERIALASFQQCLLVGAVVTIVVMLSKATLGDLGLPEFADGFLRDAKLGFFTWLAILLPVFGLQAVLVIIFRQPSQNPLIHALSDSPDPLIFVVGFIAAVVVAPVCEEITFRLLLQGWLEKFEDRLVRRDASGAPDDGTNQAISGEASFSNPISGDIESSTETLIMIRPAQRGLGGLPHGWLPIWISSTFFSLAHFGYGPDPIPLFVFALILGFVYQRTHRIIPGIVAHAAFNLLTLVMLWRMIVSGGAE